MARNDVGEERFNRETRERDGEERRIADRHATLAAKGFAREDVEGTA